MIRETQLDLRIFLQTLLLRAQNTQNRRLQHDKDVNLTVVYVPVPGESVKNLSWRRDTI